jgi:hypothetical protein
VIRELDRVILTDSLPEHHLVAGDIGTVVLIHGDHDGYEVEFVTLNGETVAVTSVRADQVRPVGRELAHARAMSD